MIHFNVPFTRLDFVSRTESEKGEIVKIFRPRASILREKLRKCNNFEKSLKFQRVTTILVGRKLEKLVNVVGVTLPGAPKWPFSPQIRYSVFPFILLYKRKGRIVRKREFHIV